MPSSEDNLWGVLPKGKNPYEMYNSWTYGCSHHPLAEPLLRNGKTKCKGGWWQAGMPCGGCALQARDIFSQSIQKEVIVVTQLLRKFIVKYYVTKNWLSTL